MKRSIKWIFLLLAAFLIADNWLTHSFSGPTKNFVDQDKIKLMTYNLENLFDSVNDPNKNDETYLPLSKKKSDLVRKKCLEAKKPHWVKQCLYTNWTNLKIRKKMARAAKVINSFKPDVLFVQEVENLKILEDFNKKYLGFKEVILIEGEDLRGIDVGLLTNLNLSGDPKIYSQITKKWSKKTRGILEATILLPDETPLTLYAVHFPSQSSPTKARKNGLEVLSSVSKRKPGLKIIAGDFNIIKKEEIIYNQMLKDHWTISHRLGCTKCKGTYYYHPKRSWSFFDVFLFSKEFKNHPSWKVDLESIKIFNSLKIQNTKHKTPARFNDGEDKYGVSDHWPLVVQLIRR